MMSASVFQAGGLEFSLFYSVEHNFSSTWFFFLVITTRKITDYVLFIYINSIKDCTFSVYFLFVNTVTLNVTASCP